jgi:hypothetical protein
MLELSSNFSLLKHELNFPQFASGKTFLYWRSSSWTVCEASTYCEIVFVNRVGKRKRFSIPSRRQLRSSNLYRRRWSEEVPDRIKKFRVNHPTIVHSCLRRENLDFILENSNFLFFPIHPRALRHAFRFGSEMKCWGNETRCWGNETRCWSRMSWVFTQRSEWCRRSKEIKRFPKKTHHPDEA